MEPLLFLAHRLPYPPNKGDKVRSYHFLRHLASRYRVFLGTFVDDPSDWPHVAVMKRWCAEVHVEPIVPWWNRALSLSAFLSGEAFSLPYFRSRRLADWVVQTVNRHKVRRAFVYSSPMAQYAIDLPQVRTWVDFVDMDSAKWGHYASRRRWPASSLYSREARYLFAHERRVAARAEASVFVTEEEARRFHASAPECAERVVAIGNGVDSDHFSASHSFPTPFRQGEHPIVFTGAMDYWPNVDAVVWFAREALPAIRRHQPSARFYVVGMNPEASVRALASDPAVTVTGRVPDVRPYLRHAAVVVAPLRVARGIQNKVLEAMAMAKPVIATPACAAALSAREGLELELASDARTFTAKLQELMDPARAQRMGRLAREFVLRNYAWPASFGLLDQVLEGRLHGRPQRAPATASMV